MLKPLEITDERIDFETIKSVGCGGEYLTHPKTFKHCRTEFYVPDLLQRNDYSTWTKNGSPDFTFWLTKIISRRGNHRNRVDF